MNRLSCLSLCITSALSLPAIADPLSGTIIDTNNKPVVGAKVHVHGKEQTQYTNGQGKFTIEIDADSQLHISKPNYLDQRLNITQSQDTVSVTLKPTSIESIVVYASALHSNSLEMTSPVSVIAGDQLKDASAATLGETLKKLPGVSSSYFGPVASSPILRGMDGPRVRVMQNGLDTADVSRVGPDHSVTTESLVAEQVEVLRGPATLLYGSGAIGGVVNVVDSRIPTDQLDKLEGTVEYRFDSVSEGQTAAFTLAGGDDGFNFHFDGLKRDSKDIETPFFTIQEEDEVESFEAIENSFIDAQVFTLGTSYVSDHFTFGVSYSENETEYGIPAHSHAHHEDHGEHDEDHDEHDEHDEHIDQKEE